MAAATTTPQLNEGETLGAPVGQSSPTAAAPVSPNPSSTPSVALKPGETLGAPVSSGQDHPTSFDDPRVGKLGYYVNGDGNTVIAPKDGEEYADTIKRAVEHSQGMTPEQRQAAMDRETSDTGKKVIGTLGTAAGLGVGGAAGLAAPGEIAAAGHALIPLTTGGVKAVGGWAAKNPVQAYLLFQVLKELVPGMKQAVGIVKGTPDAP